jgi:hypothetical protein
MVIVKNNETTLVINYYFLMQMKLVVINDPNSHMSHGDNGIGNTIGTVIPNS